MSERAEAEACQEPELNEAVTKALAGVFTVEGNRLKLAPFPAPITHGEFNRRMFLESFVFKAGLGVAISPEDIMEYGGITEKEFPTILKEYINAGVVVKVDNIFNEEMYKLKM